MALDFSYGHKLTNGLGQKVHGVHNGYLTSTLECWKVRFSIKSIIKSWFLGKNWLYQASCYEKAFLWIKGHWLWLGLNLCCNFVQWVLHSKGFLVKTSYFVIFETGYVCTFQLIPDLINTDIVEYSKYVVIFSYLEHVAYSRKFILKLGYLG